MTKKKVIHLIPSLECGGAESQLEKIILSTNPTELEHIVISLLDIKTSISDNLVNNNVNVVFMGLNKYNLLSVIYRLSIYFKNNVGKSTVIQSWMYHANILGFISLFPLGMTDKLIWNIRRTQVPSGITGIISKICSLISKRYPIKIVACGQAIKDSHVSSGYKESSFTVINNGIDCSLFKPSEKVRNEIREKLKIAPTSLVVGVVARFNPVKGHLIFLDAIGGLYQEKSLDENVVFLIIGRDIPTSIEIKSKIFDYSISESIILLPEQPNIWDFMPAMDLLCMPSLSEGFPNVVAEAMACQVYPIVTDVGESRRIVENTGLVVPHNDVEALKEALLFAIENFNRKNVNTRSKITSAYSLPEVINKYKSLYESCLNISK